jgi:hypothetical protein
MCWNNREELNAQRPNLTAGLVTQDNLFPGMISLDPTVGCCNQREPPNG